MILAFLAAVAAGTASGCENARTQTEMNICADGEFARADAALNAQWEKTAERMRAMDAAHRPDDGWPGYFAQLLAGQRAWLEYRDEHCVSKGYLARGGTLEPLLIATCKADLTRQRTEELRELEEGLGA